jgi:CheY-like chemotaxis protein
MAAGKSVDLARAIEAAMSRSVGIGGDRPVKVVASYPAHFPTVNGDQKKVRDIIAGLLGEAVFLIDRGQISISVELTPRREDKPWGEILFGSPQRLPLAEPWGIVHVAVEGSGLSEEVVQLLVRDLGKAPPQPHTRRDGMALHACVEHISQFGGHLWLERMAEDELRFSFALPLQAAHAAEPNLASLRRAVESRIAEKGEEAKTLLLFVEGQALRDWLAEDLASTGYRVVVEREGANVLAIARAERPDLILLDLDSRSPSAFDIAMVLKQDPVARDIPILFITSVADPQVGMRMGTVDFVVQAVGTGKLLSAINAVLGSGLPPAGRVLVVEPDDGTRETMSMMLQAHGYRVTEATAPEEAMALAERLYPGVVVVNARLAQERDYWLLRGLRQLSHDMEIFILAEALSEEEGREAISRGASGYSETARLRDLLELMRSRWEGSQKG